LLSSVSNRYVLADDDMRDADVPDVPVGDVADAAEAALVRRNFVLVSRADPDVPVVPVAA
jgi:hypothetical protein